MKYIDPSVCGASTAIQQDLALGPVTWGAPASLTTVTGTGATAFGVPMQFTIDDPRIEPCPTTGCWLWLRSCDRKGYGFATAKRNGKSASRKAHRVFWEMNRSPIPEGMYVDHICKNPACVNPDHLRVVTPRENAVYNSESFAAVNAAKKVCPKCGGEYSFLRHNPSYRYCVPCTAKRTFKNDSLRRGYRLDAEPTP